MRFAQKHTDPPDLQPKVAVSLTNFQEFASALKDNTAATKNDNLEVLSQLYGFHTFAHGKQKDTNVVLIELGLTRTNGLRVRPANFSVLLVEALDKDFAVASFSIVSEDALLEGLSKLAEHIVRF
jgi:hypothetical protein